MKVMQNVDLYKEFNLSRPNGAKGYLDCYLLENYKEISHNRKRPAMLVVPGGGYCHVSNREREAVAMKYLVKGYNVFTLEYSCAPLGYPHAHIEASMAIAYIKKNADVLGVNPDNVCAVGFSAGGHLVGCLATLFERHVLDVLGEDKKLVRPDACILMYPVISYQEGCHANSFTMLGGDDEELKKSLSLENCVTEKSVPCYIAHTFGDTVVSVKNSLLFANAYHCAGVPFSLHIFEKGNHGLSVNDITCDCRENLAQRSNGTTVDFASWVEESHIWLKERGFEIID